MSKDCAAPDEESVKAARDSTGKDSTEVADETKVREVNAGTSSADARLLARLRMPIDQGGFDGFHPDGLCVSAATRIEELLSALGTEQAMHAAWRKRAEEAEARESQASAAAEARGAEGERGLCIADAKGERLSGETGEESDEAYNTAIEHVIGAIIARADSLTQTEKTDG